MISNWRVPCYLCMLFLVLLFICSEKEDMCLSVHKQCVPALILSSKEGCVGSTFLTRIYFLWRVCTSLPHEMHSFLPIFLHQPSTYMDMLASHLMGSCFHRYHRRSLTLVSGMPSPDALKTIHPQGP